MFCVFHGQARHLIECLMGIVKWTDLEGQKMKKEDMDLSFWGEGRTHTADCVPCLT